LSSKNIYLSSLTSMTTDSLKYLESWRVRKRNSKKVLFSIVKPDGLLESSLLGTRDVKCLCIWFVVTMAIAFAKARLQFAIVPQHVASKRAFRRSATSQDPLGIDKSCNISIISDLLLSWRVRDEIQYWSNSPKQLREK